jgi:hypothetical protein
MKLLEPFPTTLTLCFTPEHLGVEPHYASPPIRTEDFSTFAAWVVERYAGTRPGGERIFGNAALQPQEVSLHG